MSYDQILQILHIIAKYLGHIIAIVCLVQIYIIYYIKRKEFFADLRGKDLTWQLVEISAISWYILFPGLVIMSVLGLIVPLEVWATMDTIYLLNLGAKRLDKYIELKGKLNESSNSKKDN